MIRAKTIVLLLAGASLTLTTACTDPGNPGGGQPGDKTQQGVLIGGLLGAVAGAIVSDDKGKGIIRGAAIGAGTGALLGYSLDKQEAELRNSLGNSATITNMGDRLIVTMSQDILFASDSASLQPGIVDELRSIAASLNTYPNSTVQVLGHTDDQGSAEYNYDLSQRRAGSVSGVLIGAGVSAQRVQTIGRGEDQPVASNLTSQGRAQNRRVDIVILPKA